MNKSKVSCVGGLAFVMPGSESDLVLEVLHWNQALLYFFFCGVLRGGCWPTLPSPLQQDCPAFAAVGWVPGYFQGKDCCVRPTCHLLAKIFWILRAESLLSPAVPSAARMNLPTGLYQGMLLEWLGMQCFILCKVQVPDE